MVRASRLRNSVWSTTAVFTALIVAGGVIAALLILAPVFGVVAFQSHRENQLLDSLERDARTVTPSGVRERTLERFGCGELADSEPSTVRRVLDVGDDLELAAVRQAALAGYTDPRQGWQMNEFRPDESVVKDGRVLNVLLEPDEHALVVVVGGDDLC